ncbi:MAG: response regulator [Alphaproteobacteria bacterium]|jgi:DNA-binding NarL/FixJ family response regulator|nr:response regulator [Alphaproteobacteria bacterium]MBT4546119.1 response regulator [Alphaproteobacteria bacterium]MBT7744450.1 response regulator [Alphaproteobacteria bacterium]
MSNNSKPDVLIVDDDQHILELVTSLLQTLDCNVVGSALDGEEGLALFREKQPDLVLLDFMMPGLSGLETLQQILAIKSDANVVMLTAVESNAVSDDCILAGAKDFVRKDQQPGDLTKRLADVIAKIAAL